jgi:hypothetical protein
MLWVLGKVCSRWRPEAAWVGPRILNAILLKNTTTGTIVSPFQQALHNSRETQLSFEFSVRGIEFEWGLSR